MKKRLLRGRQAVMGLSAVMTLAFGFPAFAGPADDIALNQQAAENTAYGPAAGDQMTGESGQEAAGQGNINQSTQQLQEREVSEEEIDHFFEGSVFTGDSVMMGFRNYCMRSQEPFLKSIQFLASGSFSVHNALWPVGGKSVHPIFQGVQRPVWESISMIQPSKVFMFFGLNDLNMGSDTIPYYQQVIANIKQVVPGAEIHIISMTYTLRGKGKGQLNNDNIRVFNSRLQQLAQENGYGFMDLATPLSDANGDLAAEYCSDQYVHQTNAAYGVWRNVLREYAGEYLKYTPAPQ